MRGIGQPAGRIDTHSHLLPGIDDGCKTVAESIACARVLVANGYTHAFCTPHIWAKYVGVSRASVPRWCAALQAELDAAGVPLTLVPGGELNLFLGVTRTPADDIVPLALGRHVLCDIWAAEIPHFFEESVRWLQDELGLTVILAHPERMRAVQDRPERVEYFASLGMLLQGNLQCFADPPGADTRRCAEQFLLEGRYFMLGSDTHGPETIDVRMRGLKRVVELVGNARTNVLTRENPMKLIPSASAES
ncbi:MAG TPA: CpsB/CapC family capsule biosynthesis tyrosine phosphatase [Tepidisphaeraceae bacterium]|nr:CpsB/CapC family capsule biosynthesis tyrosine phosphatase [Tepidisphaeraceae bacterium]